MALRAIYAVALILALSSCGIPDKDDLDNAIEDYTHELAQQMNDCNKYSGEVCVLIAIPLSQSAFVQAY